MVFLNVDFLFEICFIGHLSWNSVTSVFWLGKVALFAMGWSLSTERRIMCKDSAFVSALARKSKCFRSWQENRWFKKRFGWENCTLTILSLLIHSCLSKAKLCWHLIYANTRKTRRSGVYDYVIKQMVNGSACTIELWCTWEFAKHSRS